MTLTSWKKEPKDNGITIFGTREHLQEERHKVANPEHTGGWKDEPCPPKYKTPDSTTRGGGSQSRQADPNR